jgi:capsular exopolysaccharide synthesis family protein
MSSLRSPGTLLEYWRTVKRRRRVLAATVVVVVLATAIVTFTRQPLFRASATLIVEPDIPELASFTGATPRALTRQFYETQYAIIRSNAIVSQVHRDCQLEKDPFKTTVDVLRNRITVDPVPYSRLVRISVDHPHRETAIKLTSTLAEVYIEHSLEDRRAASRNAFEWLSEQIESLKSKVEESERALLEYSSQEDVVSLNRRQELLEERLAALSREHDQLASRALELEVVLREMEKLGQNPATVESLPRLLESTQVQNLKEELNTLSLELARISKRYKLKHPDVVSLQSQIADVQERLVAELEKIRRSLEVEHHITVAKERATATDLEAVKLESRQVAEHAIRYGVLEREAQSNREMFDVLLQRLREADVSGTVSGQNIRILDRAKALKRPYKPRKMLNLLVSVIAGFGLGLMLCFVIEHVDNTLKNEEDVEAYLGQQIVGLVPFEKGLQRAIEGAPASIAQAYNVVKTRLQLYSRDHVLRTLLVSSAVRGEGKSLSAASIAASFARAGTRVLLVDADLFQGAARALVAPGNPDVPLRGLSDCFLNDTPLDELIAPTGIPNLELLPSGLIPPNPAEPMGSVKMRQLIEWMRERYDLVVLDSPPVTAALDVAFLGSVIDGIVVVVKANSTARELVKRVVSQLKEANGNVIGVLLNFAEISADAIGSYHYYYYRRDRENGAEPGASGERTAVS